MNIDYLGTIPPATKGIGSWCIDTSTLYKLNNGYKTSNRVVFSYSPHSPCLDFVPASDKQFRLFLSLLPFKQNQRTLKMSEKINCPGCGYETTKEECGWSHSCTDYLKEKLKEKEAECEMLRSKISFMPKLSAYPKGGCTWRMCINKVYFGLVYGVWQKADCQATAKHRYELGLNKGKQNE